jgi:hypothetical protein
MFVFGPVFPCLPILSTFNFQPLLSMNAFSWLSFRWRQLWSSVLFERLVASSAFLGSLL